MDSKLKKYLNEDIFLPMGDKELEDVVRQGPVKIVVWDSFLDKLASQYEFKFLKFDPNGSEADYGVILLYKGPPEKKGAFMTATATIFKQAGLHITVSEDEQ
jgi:hypothetical protein